MLVTIIVDASFYLKPRSAAWAFWTISNLGKLQYSGLFHREVLDSNHAELAAIANALHVSLPNAVCYGVKKVLIQTDSMTAINAINGKYEGKYGAAIKTIYTLIEKYEIEFEMRHVKGHVGKGTPRNYCQDWCDQESRRIAKRNWNKIISKKISNKKRVRKKKPIKKP